MQGTNRDYRRSGPIWPRPPTAKWLLEAALSSENFTSLSLSGDITSKCTWTLTSSVFTSYGFAISRQGRQAPRE
eukprot:3605364-Amphidinium_carterae.1